MAEKLLQTRIQLKHDIEANWDKATAFKPKAGEIIIYDVDTNHNLPRLKVGNGNTVVKNLPFVGELTTADIESLIGYTPSQVIITSDVGPYTLTVKTGDGNTEETFNIPLTTDSKYGVVKVGGNISVSDGTISLTKTNVIAALGYTPATQNAASGGDGGSSGLMTAEDKAKLDAIEAEANKYVLPVASSTLGGVKTTSTVYNTTGLTPTPIINGIPYYKDSKTSLNDLGITATADELNKLDGVNATTAEINKLAGLTASTTELNYIKGVTSTIQTQLNNKIPNTRKVNGKQLNADITLTAADVSAIATSKIGQANGVAELDSDGRVPASQLPSYVDDVLEYASKSSFPTANVEAGKIYVAKDTNLTYRWSGTDYVEISPSLALGTTASTAYRGDYGNAAYQHAVTNKGKKFTSGLYKIATNAEGHVTDATNVAKADITALGIPAQDTTYQNASSTSDGLMSKEDKIKLASIASGATAITVDTALSATSINPVQNHVIKDALDLKIDASTRAAVNGIASLDENGKIPISQLPSYVDNVLEFDTKAEFPVEGLAGRIYIDKTDNKSYRWSGTEYVEISPSLTLGTLSSTAFRGDYGDVAYQHALKKGSEFLMGFYKVATNAEGHITGASYVTIDDLTRLGAAKAEDIQNYDEVTTTTAGLMSAADKKKLDTIEEYATVGTIDSKFSTTSVNGVQNKLVTLALQGKLDVSLLGKANGVAGLDSNSKVALDNLPVGFTSNSVLRGDYGNIAYQHALAKGSEYALDFYKFKTNAEGHIVNAVAVERKDIIDLIGNILTDTTCCLTDMTQNDFSTKTNADWQSLYNEGTHYALVGEESNSWFIVDNLTTDDSEKALSAKQGYVLNNALTQAISGLENTYVKKAGDTMTGALTSTMDTSSWWIGCAFNGAFNSRIAPTVNSASSALTMKTTAGSWGLCTLYNTNSLYFVYGTDTNYSAMTNTTVNTAYITSSGQLYGAVWNDYAEYRSASITAPGYVVREDKSGIMQLADDRLLPACEIISDTFGFAIGETDDCKTPIAATGRVLAYPYEDRDSYELGDPVCSGPGGTVSKMSREEVRLYPERMLGYVSEIPSYKTWGSGNVEVNGRIWIRVK